VSEGTQSFEHHVRVVPPFHFVILPILGVNLLWSLYQAFKAPAWPTLLAVLVAFALSGMAIYARNFTLTVQDRVIPPRDAPAPRAAVCRRTCTPGSPADRRTARGTALRER
jgi:hypothetical protein